MINNPLNTAKRRQPPRVVVAQRVIDKIAAGAILYPDEETGEALVGLVIPQEGQPDPDLYVLDTIAPDQEAIEREIYMVEQGDDLQDEIMYWFAINWKRFRDLRRASYGSALAAKWDAPLRYLGDWHKQPGLMFMPSQGDLMTAKTILRDEENDMPQLLAPIVTIVPQDLEPDENGYDLFVPLEDEEGFQARINFWYLARKMPEFIAAKPEVLPDDMLPSLPSIGWHLRDRDRFQGEYDLLVEDGLAVSIVEWDADEQPPLEICFMMARMGGAHVYILVTDRNYPDVPPYARVAPLLAVEDDEDMFEQLWASSRKVAPEDMPEDWAWNPEETRLLDLLWAAEASVEL